MVSLISRLKRYTLSVVHHLGETHREEDGKITLVACLMMLALVALIGLIGNAGHTVHQKLETQNAADSAAFNSALWMARGMNALTATNHLLGEATALCAVHEALGGPGLDLRIQQNTSENRTLDGIINSVRETAPIGSPVPSPFGYTPPPIIRLDKRIVDFVTDRTTPNTSDPLAAFASIYDSQMTLKRELAVLLPAKSFANAGFFVPPPWGYATAALAYGVHIYSSSQIVLIGKEWVILEVLETVAKAFTQLKVNVIEAQLIPTLSAHADFVASYDADSEEFDEGILNTAIERMLIETQDRHDVQTAIFPSAEQIRLPVIPEPVPNLSPTTDKVDGWGDDQATPVSLPGLNLAELRNNLGESQRKMDRRVKQVSDDLDQLDEFEELIDNRLQEGELDPEERRELEAEKRGDSGVAEQTAG